MSSKLLGEAVAAYRNALKIQTHEQLPQQWAATQNNLGNALQNQGERAEGAEASRLMGEAVAAYQEALRVRTREQFPQDWAGTQVNLGNALRLQGQRATNAEAAKLLGEAIRAYREVLTVYTREQLPQQWAMTQSNLGNTLVRQGERLEGSEQARLLNEAVQAYREALKVRTREQLPQEWARIQTNLGQAYILLRDWKNAIVSFESVLYFYPTNRRAYHSLTSIYHEQLFEYAKAFERYQKWNSRLPQDMSVLPDFAETHFTTKRFSEFSQRVKPLLADPQLSPNTKIALQMIEVANLLALDNAPQVSAALTALGKSISDQEIGFRIRWNFNGTLNFINHEEKFAPYRAWLNQFFGIARGENREAILKALREAQEQFPK